VEGKVPGVKGLSFVDGVAWWAAGRGELEVVAKLEQAAAAAVYSLGS